MYYFDCHCDDIKSVFCWYGRLSEFPYLYLSLVWRCWVASTYIRSLYSSRSCTSILQVSHNCTVATPKSICRFYTWVFPSCCKCFPPTNEFACFREGGINSLDKLATHHLWIVSIIWPCFLVISYLCLHFYVFCIIQDINNSFQLFIYEVSHLLGLRAAHSR